MRVVFRSVPPGRDPLTPYPYPDDRWAGGADVEPAIYGSDTLMAVHAEIAKHYEMDGYTAWAGVERDIMTGTLDITAFLNLLDSNNCRLLDVTEHNLTLDCSATFPKEQAFLEPRKCYQHAISNAMDGVISYSAAYEGAHVFVVRRSAVERGVISNIRIERVSMPASLRNDRARRIGTPPI